METEPPNQPPDKRERLEPSKLPRERKEEVKREGRGNRNNRKHRKDKICIV